jgi:uncharacterized protein
MEGVMAVMKPATRLVVWAAGCLAAAVWALPAGAQQTGSQPEARIIVIGEGSVSLSPDYAQISAGVITKAKTAKEATDSNTKLMSAITAMLLDSGIAQKDIRTSRFSVQPVYAPPQPNTEPRLVGFSISNQLSVTIRQIATVGDMLDRLIGAGATDVGSIQFLHNDTSKALDQAREAAVADARRKAELYAQAAGLNLGRVAWITEDSGFGPPVGVAAMRDGALKASVPIATGEDTLHVRITVGFDIAGR